jgi:hypothetical protein
MFWIRVMGHIWYNNRLTVILQLNFVKNKVLLAEPATPISNTNYVSVLLDIGVARIPLVESILHLSTNPVIKVPLKGPCQNDK